MLLKKKNRRRKVIKYFFLILLLFITSIVVYVSNINNFKREGTFQISKNTAPIEIHRDENGIPYIIAENKADAIRGQGFVTAQDRLFQIEYFRRLIKGQLASVIGTSMLQSDIKMRVLNITQNSKNSYKYLDDTTKNFLQWYCEGFNEYLNVAEDEFPFELGLLNIEPIPLTPLDILNIIHFIGLTHGKNLDDEILSLNLSTQIDWKNDLFPYNINPDRKKPLPLPIDSLSIGFSEKSNVTSSSQLPSYLVTPPEFGSNNWAISASKSKSGKVIVCNDPHLDARLLPGIFHPVGIFCPEFKSVGLSIPGVPGLIVGRNEYVAFGVTNAYGDSQDLFIEKTEGDYYFKNNDKLPMKIRKEIIQIKDSTNVEIQVRSTAQGPILSDFEIFGVKTKDIVSLRWSQALSKNKSLGIERALEAKNVFEFRDALMEIDNMFFNFVIGDVEGNIAHQTTGLVPIKSNGQGAKPQFPDQLINDFIPKKEMPHSINPKKGWVGTANHDTRPDDYPYYYSSHFSPNYRYTRIQEILNKSDTFDANDLWELILDCKNKQAELLTPLFVAALHKKEHTRDLAMILDEWNYTDTIDERGAAVYNVLYTILCGLILNDELPDELEESFWNNGYYWMQRIDDFIVSDHQFIDNTATPEREPLEDLIIEAGIQTKDYLTKKIGKNQDKWTWSEIHTVYFASPLRQKGIGKSILGFEEFPKNGSNQTINRGGYNKTNDLNFETAWFSTFRMVADLNDNEKMMGSLSGGTSSRVFHPYYKSQLKTWKEEKWVPYWISKERVLEYSKFKLVLD